MGIRKRPGHLAQHSAGVVAGQGTLTPDPLAQRLALDVGHDEVDQVVGLFDGVNGNEVWVAQAGGGAGLIEEPVPEGWLPGDIRAEKLDGDGTVEPDIAGQEDHAHSSPSDLALEGVAAYQRPLQAEKEQIVVRTFGHGCLRGTDNEV